MSDLLKKCASILGIEDPLLLQGTGIRVSARKLQRVAAVSQRIMDLTRTVVLPSRKKLLIVGLPEDVPRAVEEVVAFLMPPERTVRIKLTCSGSEIPRREMRKIEKDTGCHVLFHGDNSASIFGDVSEIERARACIRKLTPVTFKLPWLHLEDVDVALNEYKVVITEVQGLLSVRGSEWGAREATKMLVGEYSVQTTLELSPQVRPKLQIVKLSCGTEIVVRENQVRFTGPVSAVDVARSRILDSLPVVLSFRVHERFREVLDQVHRVMDRTNVAVDTTRNPGGLTVKLEGSTGNVYEARRRIFDLCYPQGDDRIDLSTSLKNAGLHKYAELFEREEVDKEMFLTLTEDDLKDIGIAALGARRKMSMLIKRETAERIPAMPSVREIE